MRECYFDPAMQAHKMRMQSIYREQRRAAFIQKHAGKFILLASAVSAVAGFFAGRLI